MEEVTAYCKCGMVLIESSDEEDVRDWEKKIRDEEEKSEGLPVIRTEGFTWIGDDFVAISFRSPKVVERWTRNREDCPFSKHPRAKTCPGCFERYLEENNIRRR